MSTEQAASNPGAVAAQKAVQDVFPVRQVLGLLQRNERLSEQPAEAPTKLPEHQENQDFNRQSAVPPSEDIVAESPPSQQDEAGLGGPLGKGEGVETLSCPKCGKAFPTDTSLRTHLATVTPCCDQPVPELLSRDDKWESKACFKCGKTFASWQGLRGHLNRVKPCDLDKPAVAAPRRRPAASRTCTKCGKTFSSPQSLRIHMNRVKPCDQDQKSGSTPTTPPATTSPTPSLMMNAEELKKEAERKVRARYQARKAYLKKRGRLSELGDPPSVFYQSGVNQKAAESSVSKPDLKRSAPDEPLHESENGDPSNIEVKKPRVQEEAPEKEVSTDSPSDVSGLTQPAISTSAQPAIVKKAQVAEGGFLHRSNKGHGGDLLAGGCSCPPCVRRWARKLMNRMQQLEDEVLTLRQIKSGGETGSVDSSMTRNAASEAKTAKPSTAEVRRSIPSITRTGLSGNSTSGSVLSQAKPAEIFRSLASSGSGTGTLQVPGGDGSTCSSGSNTNLSRSGGQAPHGGDRFGDVLRSDDTQQQPTTSAMQGLGSDKRSLLDAYTHMNDQILINERTVEDSTGHVQILVGYNPATAMDFRRQVQELRMSITAEKSKRDVTVAALIAHEWRLRRVEFKRLLENAGPQSSPNEEQAFHVKWSELAKQVSDKDKSIADLEKRMDSLGELGNIRFRYAEMGELSSKMAAEYAAKMSLEGERDGIYVGLVKSSSRIRSLVRNALQ